MSGMSRAESRVLQFKSYEAGVSAFSSEALDFIHLDEEAEQDIYVECCVRTMTRGGVVYLTATPENGMTELMRQMMDALRDQIPFTEPDSKPYVVMAGWDDAPHLTEAAKKDLEAKIPAYQRDSKIRGIPQLGKGAIYPIAESDIKVRPFSIPEHWPTSIRTRRWQQHWGSVVRQRPGAGHHLRLPGVLPERRY